MKSNLAWILFGSAVISWGAFAAETETATATLPTPPAPSALARAAVTVLPFKDTSPEAGLDIPLAPGAKFDVNDPMPWLADGLPGSLEYALERAGAVNLLARKDFAYALKKRKDLQLASDTPADILAEVAFREGLTHYVTGSFLKNKKDLSFKVEVKTSAGETVAAREFAGTVDNIFALVTDAAKFVVGAVGGDAAGLIPREPTKDFEALMWFSRGAGRFYTGERITFMLKAVEKDPSFAEAYLALAEACRAEKNYADARTYFERSREIADYYPSAAVGLAQVKRKLEPADVEGAVALCYEALAIDPSYAPAYDCLGGIYTGAGDYERARAAYEKYTQVWPTSKDGYYGLGTTLFYVGKPSPQWKKILQDAITAYEKSLAIDPDFAACHYNIASLYKIFEDVQKASFHFRRYIELEPEAPNRKEIEETLAAWQEKYKLK